MSGAAILIFLRKWILPVLTFGITLPVWVFLVGGGWLYFDKASAVRAAVDKAVTKLVAGAEIEALNAKLEEQRRISAWSDSKANEANQIAETERRARVDLETQLTLSEIDRKNQADELAQIESQPIAADCRVDQSLLERLRNR